MRDVSLRSPERNRDVVAFVTTRVTTVGHVPMDEVTVGSLWQHHSGIVYTVLHLANVANVNEKYPVSVVYIGQNGNVWVKTLENFLSKMMLYKLL